MNTRTRVAIIGGGCGALSAAFWLTATADLRAKYKVTVYTEGWRLGGKGASGRTQSDQRVLEHGLHVMLGFYDVVFQTVRRCYEEMPHAADDAFPTIDDAIEPQRRLALLLALPPGDPVDRHARVIDMPRWPGTPGDTALGSEVSIAYMKEAIERLLAMLHDTFAAKLLTMIPPPLRPVVEFEILAAADALSKAIELARQDATAGVLALVAGLQQTFKFVASVLRSCFSGTPEPVKYDCYLAYCFIDVGLAGLVGFLKDVFPLGEQGYDCINHLEFRTWLTSHGCDRVAADSPLVTCIYDLAFAYPQGDSSNAANGSAAAGALLRLFVRMLLTYKDAPVWKMNGGMGDIIFTPLYRTLQQRGVEFQFFHRAAALNFQGGRVTSIEFARQAAPRSGTYDPLVRQRFQSGLAWDCWPAEPDWRQIDDGEPHDVDFEDSWDTTAIGSHTLSDFDLVVLAIPPDAARHCTSQITNARWTEMLNNSSSVATRSVQLWLDTDVAGMGWPHGRTLAACYVDPLRSWAEMSHLLPFESAHGVRSVQYWCGTYKHPMTFPAPGTHQPQFRKMQHAASGSEAHAWLDKHTGDLWPRGSNGHGGIDPARVVHHYARANVGYSERYVLSLPGSIQFRLDPGWLGVPNLYLAGDWTRTSINGSCAEAAFESGWRAALAIRGDDA